MSPPNLVKLHYFLFMQQVKIKPPQRSLEAVQ